MLTNQQALARMADDIQLRGLSQSTVRNYSTAVREFLRFTGQPIGELDETNIRKYLIHLIDEKKFEPKTVNLHSSAIRFFFAVTLNRTMNYLQIPRMKEPKKLPDILTRDEVLQLIAQASNAKHKALMLTAYGSGLRVSELVSLKVTDIDSKSMRVFVRGGKGKKDRYTILSEKSLLALRDYWRKYRPKNPEGYIFPSSKGAGHLHKDTVGYAIDRAHSIAGFRKKASAHTLRHCFATHLLEDGYSIFQIKDMLGHSSIRSTIIYLHLANTTSGVTSPADKLPEKFECAPL